MESENASMIWGESSSAQTRLFVVAIVAWEVSHNVLPLRPKADHDMDLVDHAHRIG